MTLGGKGLSFKNNCEDLSSIQSIFFIAPFSLTHRKSFIIALLMISTDVLTCFEIQARLNPNHLDLLDENPQPKVKPRRNTLAIVNWKLKVCKRFYKLEGIRVGIWTKCLK